jgi:ER lumen protein retaining receptor
LLYLLSPYNTFMKIAFVALTAVLIFLMRCKKPFCLTYNAEADDFSYVKYLLGPCFLVSLIFTYEWNPFEIGWTFSIILEAFSILPQLTLLYKVKEVENLTSHYIFCLGAYRALYIINWA